jgi:hypothetical protein
MGMSDHAIQQRDNVDSAGDKAGTALEGNRRFGLARGLPGPLPPGETVLWQGSPDWWSLARRVLHVHQITGYFVLLLAWAIGSAVMQHGITDPAVVPTLLLVPLALVAVGALALFAWLVARTTTYTLTSRRVVIQFGVALPMTVNIPFRLINAAAVKCGADGSGDVALTLAEGTRLAYLIMWPHVRPWHLTRTEPALRGVASANEVARILSRALAASAGQPVAPAPAVLAPGKDSVAAGAAAA